MYLLLWARHCSFSNWGMAALKYCISFCCRTKSMSYMYPYIPSLTNLPPQTPIPTIQVITEHRAELPALYSRFPLAAYCFTPGREHRSISASQFTPATLPVSTLLFSTLCLYRCCFISKLCLTLCSLVDGSTPGPSILHYLQECFQIHVHWVSDSI